MKDFYRPKVTTADDPTLKEPLNVTLEEMEQWKIENDNELQALFEKNTCIETPSPEQAPLQSNVVVKVERNDNGIVDHLKARIVAGGSF